ncbi:hypothetical protein SO802_002442 [Lithocarpus litseifolius]|uniref:Uncharacterized protein n=1 Tax=Lithocarpus litseifolius TaxID=425828 RepID=A0AAW2E0S0_9ROSI
MVEKEVVKKASFFLVLQEPRDASPTVFLEEITPHQKKHTSGDKGKDKVGASVWEDAATTLGRAHNIITPDDLKELSRIPSHEIALGETIHITTEYLTNEEIVVMVDFKVEALEALTEELKVEKSLTV